MSFSSCSKRWLSNINFKYLRKGQIQNLQLFLNSVKKEKLHTFSIKLFTKIRTVYFAWCRSVVRDTSNSSILWMCSDRQLFAVGPNGRIGRRCSALHIQQNCHRYNTIRLWHIELHCTYILQGMIGTSARITTLPIDILFAGAISINQWLTIQIAMFWTSWTIILGSNYLIERETN